MIDTHVHLDRLLEAGPALVRAAVDVGVRGFVSIGVDPRFPQGLSGAVPEGIEVKTVLGLHPQEVRDADDVDDAFACLQRRLDAEPAVVAIGECGLDARPGVGNAALHEQVFRRHLQIAHARGLPVVLHGVRRDGPMLTVLDDEARVDGVWHGFSGSRDTMLLAVKRGLFISVGFMVLDERARRLREAVPAIPDDRLLIETDAPPLAPARLPDVVDAVARLRGSTREHIVALTTANARRLFRWPAP
ncbi:MAG: TatD family hydrolase [Deltaproteobacteria bacterium]|nr:TatD family hydrolase [Deltaproteobacteria bacterium]